MITALKKEHDKVLDELLKGLNKLKGKEDIEEELDLNSTIEQINKSRVLLDQKYEDYINNGSKEDLRALILVGVLTASLDGAIELFEIVREMSMIVELEKMLNNN